MFLHGNDPSTGHGGDSRTGNHSMSNNRTVLLEVQGTHERETTHWKVLTRKQHSICTHVRELFESLERVEFVDSLESRARARQTIIWQLVLIGEKLHWESESFSKDSLHFPDPALLRH